MEWTRDDDEEMIEDAIELRFPTGFRLALDLREPDPRDGQDDAPLSRPKQDPPALPPPRGLDNSRARILLAWNMVGLSLFGGKRRPTLQDVSDGAEGVLLAMAMEKHGGNITHVAKELNTSRRTVRARLRRGGMYDWSRMRSGPEGEGDDADDENGNGLDYQDGVERRNGEHAQGNERAPGGRVQADGDR